MGKFRKIAIVLSIGILTGYLACITVGPAELFPPQLILFIPFAFLCALIVHIILVIRSMQPTSGITTFTSFLPLWFIAGGIPGIYIADRQQELQNARNTEAAKVMVSLIDRHRAIYGEVPKSLLEMQQSCPYTIPGLRYGLTIKDFDYNKDIGNNNTFQLSYLNGMDLVNYIDSNKTWISYSTFQ